MTTYFCLLWALHVGGAQICTQAKRTPTHKKNNFKNLQPGVVTCTCNSNKKRAAQMRLELQSEFKMSAGYRVTSLKHKGP